jgi:hypothetical protein
MGLYVFITWSYKTLLKSSVHLMGERVAEVPFGHEPDGPTAYHVRRAQVG